MAARAGLSDFAYEYTRYMLRPSSLYDDWYFTENVNDSEDFKRSPELGSHGAYVMAISAMMFDGETDEYIKAFPAIPQEWQAIGVDFTKMLAKGNLVVSGTYANEQTTVTVQNLSAEDVVRDFYVRVAEGSGAAVYNGVTYGIVDGCMALIEGVSIPAGQTITLTVSGIEAEVEGDSFRGLSPVEGSDRVRTENLPFSWTLADQASSYRLVVKYADIRIAFLAHAGDDKVGIGDEPDTGQLVASEPVVSGNGVNYFLHLELPPIIYFCLSAGRKRHSGSL